MSTPRTLHREIDPICVALRAERKRRGLTLMQVAELSGLTFQLISAWELGYQRPVLGNARVWAAALGCELGLVVGDSWQGTNGR